jgi:hypothetical protein
MARLNPLNMPVFEVTRNDAGNVTSVTLGDQALPLQHILSYTITEDAADISRVTVTFIAVSSHRTLPKEPESA